MRYLVFFIILITLITILLTKIRIELEYVSKGRKDHLVLTITALWGLIRYKLDITDRFKSKEKPESEASDKYKHLKQIYKIMHKLKIYLSKKLVIELFKLKVEFGTGEAFYTGILSGLAWTFAGFVTSFIGNNFRMDKKDIDIRPNFSESKFNMLLDCIFYIKVVHIIVVGTKILYMFLKDKRKAKRTIGGDLVG